MINPRFGRLEKVNFQEIWNNEVDNFLLWLAQGENLALLSKALGLDLKLETQVNQPDDAASHLICKEMNSNRWVVIDNPVGQTDFSYLGQILVLASGYSPVDVIWMAGLFKPEQRVLLEWLNQVTAETVHFYGLEIEFWRIGESPLAPRFTMVCSPSGGQVVPETGEFSPPSREMDTSPNLLRRDGSGELRRALSETPPTTASEEQPTFPSGMLRNRQEEPSTKIPQTPSGMLRAAAQENDRAPSGALRDFQQSSTTVTPSGMLARLKMEQEGEASAEPGQGESDLELTEPQQLYLGFWSQFWQEVVTWESEMPTQKAMTQGWVTFPLGMENNYLIAFLSTDHNLAGLGLVMDGQDSKDHYQVLYQEKDAIENEIGAALDWRELPSRNESHIYLHNREVVPSDRNRWPEYTQWFANALETFTHVLGTRVRTLHEQEYKRNRSFFS